MGSSWFKQIPVRRSASMRKILREGRVKAAPRPKITVHQLRKCARRMQVGKVEVVYYVLSDISNLYGFSTNLLQEQWVAGKMPEPMMVRYLRNRTVQPIYTRGQAEAIVRVLNDVFKQGVRYWIPERYPEHWEMMHKGCDRSLKIMQAYLTRNNGNSVLEQKKIIWLDDADII